MRKLSDSEFFAQCSRIDLLVMDVDGVLTDGRIIVTSDGKEAKSFNVKDGHGLVMALRSGLKIAWVSGRASEVTTIRARELGVELVIQGQRDKLPAVRGLARDLGVPLEKAAYIGDDVVDLEAMKACGLAIAVSDALPDVIDAAHWVTRTKGGHGAVREILDIILRSKSQRPG